MSRTDLSEFHIRRKSICWECGVDQVSDWKWKRLVSNPDYFSRDMIVPSGFTRVYVTQHQGRAVFVYQLKTESIFVIIVYLSYFHDTWVGTLFVDGITGRSNAIVKPNISCNPWEIIIEKFGNITGIGFPHCYFRGERYYVRFGTLCLIRTDLLWPKNFYHISHSGLWNIFASIVF